jgi:hypothetical protein
METSPVRDFCHKYQTFAILPNPSRTVESTAFACYGPRLGFNPSNMLPATSLTLASIESVHEVIATL